MAARAAWRGVNFLEIEAMSLNLGLRTPRMSKLIAPTLADFPVTSLEKLRFADTDRNGHISNSVFAVCCQNARMEILCDPRRVPIPPNTQFVIAKLVLEFWFEMQWPGTVEVGTRVERLGRCSVTLAQALFLNKRCVAIAESTVALMDAATRKSIPLPPNVCEALRELALCRTCDPPHPNEGHRNSNA
jgi:acyl-CoA thioester hydrolase